MAGPESPCSLRGRLEDSDLVCVSVRPGAFLCLLTQVSDPSGYVCLQAANSFLPVIRVLSPPLPRHGVTVSARDGDCCSQVSFCPNLRICSEFVSHRSSGLPQRSTLLSAAHRGTFTLFLTFRPVVVFPLCSDADRHAAAETTGKPRASLRRAPSGHAGLCRGRPDTGERSCPSVTRSTCHHNGAGFC